MMESTFKSIEIIENRSKSGVFHLNLNRPSHRNALSLDFFSEFPRALSTLDQNPDTSVIILSGAGKHFCSGIDLNALDSIQSSATNTSDRGRSGERLRRVIKGLQDAITAIERCRKPVIAAVQGACIGGGIDIITACDIRYCSEDAFFSVKEVDLAIVADLGTLQRLPGIVGYGNAMELALTARRFSASEAKAFGLVSSVFPSKDALDEGVSLIAHGTFASYRPRSRRHYASRIPYSLPFSQGIYETPNYDPRIAAKSPLAVTGTKAVLLRGREQTIEQGLDYVATWNSSMLISDDLVKAVSAHTKKQKTYVCQAVSVTL